MCTYTHSQVLCIHMQLAFGCTKLAWSMFNNFVIEKLKCCELVLNLPVHHIGGQEC